MVETTLSYLARMTERPFFYQYAPPAGTPVRNSKGDRRRVAVADARPLAETLSLDEHGFALVPHRTTAENLFDDRDVRTRYYPETEALVKRVTGASHVVAFDYNLRSALRAERNEAGIREPVRFAHNDYTEASGPQRVRDLLPPEEAEARLRGRFAVVNVWKPIATPVQEMPLAVCDARTIAPEDLIPTDLIYADRKGEVYSLAFNPAHRWFYFPHLEPNEAMLLKCYDSDRSLPARFTAHTAFADPTSPPDAAPRESIEVRTLVFF